MSAEFPRLSNLTRCLFIQPRRSSGTRTSYQQSTTQAKVCVWNLVYMLWSTQSSLSVWFRALTSIHLHFMWLLIPEAFEAPTWHLLQRESTRKTLKSLNIHPPQVHTLISWYTYIYSSALVLRQGCSLCNFNKTNSVSSHSVLLTRSPCVFIRLSSQDVWLCPSWISSSLPSTTTCWGTSTSFVWSPPMRSDRTSKMWCGAWNHGEMSLIL